MSAPDSPLAPRGAADEDLAPPEPTPAGRSGAAAPDDLADTVARKEARKQRARQEGKHGWAHGFGMFGMVGWSVAVPTLLGIALGVWIDSRSTSGYSWTLMLMIAGLVVGGINAWYWVSKESESD